ncbi:TPA: hypothetical protein ACTY4F_004037 [Klebsiella pneumoniae]|uniref:hypothetical protein n=1 Tax=Klebsiella pneumoniae TaxID=573 RepID=UPI00093950F7|nr:hypothetical protein [Klebsiella pneumoniae]HBR1994907.1 hypothetical protein [Klebsiella quasipneumoniae subsp. similipneumoniae]EKU0698271.1 hypothetical protein [Klebsiella pneumoniae]EKU1084461.1 hypothetical protein [Klebsiella pneumoniae]EKU1095470.1 hypothetical protein [Klebsiella pneumoniae]EKU8751129.1 hypothetical protein [Klebsiella pneumoniae]
MKLTNAQIYTLRRLSGGSKYQLRGDGKKARECRPGSGIFTNDFSAPSIPVLFRLGLVDYVHKGVREHTLFYAVTLTDTGKLAAATMNTKD